jgi:hypothetical protein
VAKGFKPPEGDGSDGEADDGVSDDLVGGDQSVERDEERRGVMPQSMRRRSIEGEGGGVRLRRVLQRR